MCAPRHSKYPGCNCNRKAYSINLKIRIPEPRQAPGPIFDLHSLHPGSFKWCSMHVINLGVALWTVGSCFKLLLMEFFCWGNGDYGQRLRTAYEDFKFWCSERRIPHLIHNYGLASNYNLAPAYMYNYSCKRQGTPNRALRRHHCDRRTARTLSYEPRPTMHQGPNL